MHKVFWSHDFGNFCCNHTLDEPPEDNCPMHTHGFMEIYYFISGNCTYTVEGTAYALKPHDILTPEEVKAFAESYIAAVGDRMDTATLSARLPLFFTVTCLRGVTWCAMAYREYCAPGRELRNEDTFRKLQAYLEPEFLQNILDNYVRKDFLG